MTCYVSRAKTGGISGALGLAEDKSEASIACRQVGPISFVGKPLEPREEMFNERHLAHLQAACASSAWSTASATRSST